MKMHKSLIYCLLLLFFNIGCKKNIESKVASAIARDIRQYPQLDNTKRLFGNGYQLVRSVKSGPFNFEIRLYAEPDSIQNNQEILVLLNSKDECYAIPLFSNLYKDYWNFPFDKPIRNIQKTNTSFNKELNNAIDKLRLNEAKTKNGRYLIYSNIINELLLTTLHCRPMDTRDTDLVYNTYLLSSDMPSELMDSAKVRLHRNFDKIKSIKHPGVWTNMWSYNCYYDERNGRIYQIIYHNDALEINNYRQDVGHVFATL